LVGFFFKDLIDGKHALLDLLQLSQKIPELRFGPQLHPVNLRMFIFSVGGALPTTWYW